MQAYGMRMIHIDPAHARPFAVVRGDGRFNMHPNNYAILDKNIESTRGNREPKAPRRFHVDKTVPLGNMDRTHHEPSSPSCDWSVRRGPCAELALSPPTELRGKFGTWAHTFPPMERMSPSHPAGAQGREGYTMHHRVMR
jgi:hypothetical protein